ncbi:hypothetical protein GCM10029992_10490 [Glycomyces albus]
MKRILGAALLAAATVAGCTGTTDQTEPTLSPSSGETSDPERIEGPGLCDDLITEPLNSLADTYGLAVDTEGGDGPRCNGFLEFIESGEPVTGINGMAVTISAERYKGDAEAESAFIAQTDPESADYELTLSSGRVPPEGLDHSAWDEFRIAVAGSDAPNQELRALLRNGAIVVSLWVEIDPTRSEADQCSPEGQGNPCAMTLDLAELWVQTEYADVLSQVVADFDQ